VRPCLQEEEEAEEEEEEEEKEEEEREEFKNYLVRGWGFSSVVASKRKALGSILNSGKKKKELSGHANTHL